MWDAYQANFPDSFACASFQSFKEVYWFILQKIVMLFKGTWKVSSQIGSWHCMHMYTHVKNAHFSFHFFVEQPLFGNVEISC